MNFPDIFKKRLPPAQKQAEIPPEEEPLGEECAVTVMDFDHTLSQFSQLSPKAKRTFLYRLVGILPRGVAECLHDYLNKRLNGKAPYIRSGNRYADRTQADSGSAGW